MPYTIDVQSTRRFPLPFMRAVASAANEAMINESVSDGAAVTLLLTDEEYIRELNHQYRGEDYATDVLSFPAGDPMPGDENLLEYLGDIAIAVPIAERQAAGKGHDTVSELQLLAVHGILHLLGYDHLDPSEKETMWEQQAMILKKLGLGEIQPTEDGHDK